MNASQSPRWKARPTASVVLRAIALVVPLAASVAASVVVARLLPRPQGFAQTLGWWAAFLACALAVLAVVDRLARRLLPLAALFSLSLVFPQRVPSRLRIALLAGSTRELNRRINDARVRGLVDEPSRAAETILVLTAALAKHDRVTRGHSERVRALTDMIAAELRLGEADTDQLRWAALLHDVGKIDIDAHVLNKPEALGESEWERMRMHPEAGERLAGSLREWLGPWFGAIGHHHERFDGGGYPKKLAGEDISLAGRIVAVADAYETMTAGRPYRRAMNVAAARKELADEAGAHFDPVVVRAFLNLSIGRLWRVVGIGAWVSSLAIIPRPMTTLAQRNPGSAGGAAALAALAALGAGVVAPKDPNVLGERLTRPPAASAPVLPSPPPAPVDPPATVAASVTASPAPSPRPTRTVAPSPAPSPSSPSPSPTATSVTPSPTATPSPTESPEPEPTCLELLLAVVQELPGSLSVERIEAVVDCVLPGAIPAGAALFLR